MKFVFSITEKKTKNEKVCLQMYNNPFGGGIVHHYYIITVWASHLSPNQRFQL